MADPDPGMSLQTWLRGVAQMTDVKRMCTQGGCGACLVVVSRVNPGTGREEHVAVNSCLHPLMTMANCAVTTPAGLGSAPAGFHPLQLRLADANGSQCGMCSPGHVMAAFSFFKNNPNPTELELENAFDGNICRCTGYFPILQAFKSFVPSSNKTPESDKGVDLSLSEADLMLPHQAPGAGLSASAPVAMAATRTATALKANASWFSPTSLGSAFAALQQVPGARVILGNTGVGVYPYAPGSFPPAIVSLYGIPELHTLSLSSSELTVGAGVSIARLLSYLEEHVAASASFPALIKHIKKVANMPVRNAASWVGNLVLTHDNPDFPSDLFTIFEAAGGSLTLASPSNQNGTSMDFQTFLGTSLDNVIVTRMTLPLLSASNTVFRTYKVMQRHVNSHAYVNAGFCVTLSASSATTIESARIVYGGVGPHAVRAPNTEAFLAGKSITDQSTLTGALASLSHELVPDAAQGNVAYRTSLVTALFYTYYCALLPAASLPPSLETVVDPYERGVSAQTTVFKTNPATAPVGQPISKLTATLQASGEAVYVDAIDPAINELYGAFVTATIGCGTLASIDPSPALALEGVHGFIGAADIPPQGTNTWWPGEVIFVPVGGPVGYNGQSLGLVVAESHELALTAAALVTATYSNQTKPVTSMAEAIAAGRFVPGAQPPVVAGDAAKALASASHVESGTFSVPSQYHFYMELQTTRATVLDGNLVQLESATQWPTMTQSCVASVLGLPNNCVDVSVRRVGGAYGGKIMCGNQIASATALASYLMQTPVRTQLDIFTNMRMVGKRFPHSMEYKVGFNEAGVISAVEGTIYTDVGYVNNMMGSATAMYIDNAYNIPNWNVVGKFVTTNTPANTACRAPGALPGITFINGVVHHVATSLGMEFEDVVKANLYKAGDMTPYGQPLPYCSIGSLVDSLAESAELASRKAQIAAFNKDSRWVKRGISMAPTKYGISLAQNGMGCHVMVNAADGTVWVRHSGIEVGQGINVKVAAVVAYELGIPIDLINVLPSSVSTIPNAGVTGGSIGSGECCKAATMAAALLNSRLAPIKSVMESMAASAGSSSSEEEEAAAAGPVGSAPAAWLALVTKANGAGVNLGAESWFVGAAGNAPFTYNSYGVAVAEVEVNVLTGEVQILNYDVLFDCGDSLNPAVDIGQVEGATVMGVGYFLSEELVYDETTGALQSDSTWTYKPPSALDIPVQLRVELLPNAPNPVGVLSSKASGEPPLTLTSSIFFAVKDAVAAARADAGTTGYFTFDAPATPEAIQQACLVEVKDFVIQ